MGARGVECVGVVINEEGQPVFGFQCDCGTPTAVAVEGLDYAAASEALEFAFTCDGCMSAHWMTVQRAIGGDSEQ